MVTQLHSKHLKIIELNEHAGSGNCEVVIVKGSILIIQDHII